MLRKVMRAIGILILLGIVFFGVVAVQSLSEKSESTAAINVDR